MPRIMCPWSTCKYNASKYANDDNGECKKEDIVLEHVETYCVECDIDKLECKSYICDKEKEYK